MYMYMYTCKRMSCIYSMSSTKAGSGCKTALAAAGPPVSAWSTPWYPTTIWARMFTSHASLPASSDMKPRSQSRPKSLWGKKCFFGGGKSWLQQKEVDLIPPQGGHLWEGEGNGIYRNATIPVTIPESIPGNYGKSHPWIRPKMEKSHYCWPRTVWCVVNMFDKNGMSPLIIANGTKCYSIL